MTQRLATPEEAKIINDLSLKISELADGIDAALGAQALVYVLGNMLGNLPIPDKLFIQTCKDAGQGIVDHAISVRNIRAGIPHPGMTDLMEK